jgi:hypothetical protein
MCIINHLKCFSDVTFMVDANFCDDEWRVLVPDEATRNSE